MNDKKSFKQQRRENQFIQNNMYHNKSSASIYTPLFLGIGFALMLLLCAYFFSLDLQKLARGEQVTMQSLFYTSYKALGGKGTLMAFYISAAVSFIGGIYGVYRRKKLKES